MDRLAEDPGLAAGLLNRERDPGVLRMAEQLKMAIFPVRWRDLSMHCSCPDWAVPCKHLAAVIRLLSQQIDADPVLVFSLRGIDLPVLLKQRGMTLDSALTARQQARLRLSLLLDQGVFGGSEPAGARPKALEGKLPQSSSLADAANSTALARLPCRAASRPGCRACPWCASR